MPTVKSLLDLAYRVDKTRIEGFPATAMMSLSLTVSLTVPAAPVGDVPKRVSESTNGVDK